MERTRGASQGGPAGFTLIELLVVVMIIGILASIGIPQYFKVVERSRIVEVQSFINAVRSAQERYFTRYGAYTNNVANLDVSFSSTCTDTGACGMKAYDLTSITVSQGLCGNAPGYNVLTTRTAARSVSVATKYANYTVSFNRCQEEYVVAGGLDGAAAIDLKQ